MLGTGRVKRRQIPAAHRDELRREPAMPVDPGADFRGIEPHHQSSAGAGRHLRARYVVVIGRGVETQHRTAGDANMICLLYTSDAADE